MGTLKLFIICILSVGLMGLIPACATKKAERNPCATRYLAVGNYSPNYESYDLDELIDYLRYLNNLPLLQRNAECEWLQRFNAIDSSLGVKVHLAFVLMSTLDCGDGREAVDLLELAAQSMEDERIRGFLSYQRGLAQRLFTQAVHNKELEQKLKRWKLKNQKMQNNYKACQQSLLDAKAKLEALKAIEESLNHTEAQ